MSRPFPSKQTSFAVAVALALVVGVVRSEDDPEPPFSGKEEPASPAVDLEKAKTDKKLAAQAERDEAASKRKLAKIAVAIHEYHDATGFLPDDVRDKNGKSLLSWRVAILPYLAKQLSRQVKFDEPWDSKHNKKLLARMPEEFRSPRVGLKGTGNTVYQTFHGSDAVFGRGQPLRMAAVTDGTSNTLMVVESSVGAPWTKPGGIPFARNAGVPDFGKAYGKRPLAAMVDGSVRVLDLKKIKPATLANAIDPMDGSVLGDDWE